MGKNILKIIIIFIIGMAGGIFSEQIFWPYFIEKPLFYKYRLEQRPIYVTEKKEVIIQENVALKNALEKAEKMIVGIKTKTKTGKILEGSGLIITSDGLVVTLADLTPHDAEIKIFWEGKMPAFQVLKRDLKENLALIKIEENNLPTAGFADLEKLRRGERVFLVGAIFEESATINFNDKVNKIASEGIVRTFNENSIQTNIFEEKILQGSPLFDIEGNVLGLNTIDREGRIIAIPAPQIRSFTGL